MILRGHQMRADTPKRDFRAISFQMLNFLENNPKGCYNMSGVEIRPPRELPKVKDKNPKYPAIANCISFK